MNVTLAPRGILQTDDARLIFRNFEGRGDKYNREGVRIFAVVIPDQNVAERMIEDGWNVKIRPPREEGDDTFMYLPVKVKFNDRGANVYLVTGKRQNKLDEEAGGLLDNVDIESVDMDVRPYDWEVNGKTGRTAYLQSIRVTQKVDRFAERWDDEEAPFDL